jgi:hypothetical protein
MEEDEAAQEEIEPRHSKSIVYVEDLRRLMVAIGQCTQVVMISCLHLGLEAAQPLGRFAWTQPNAKEPAESTLRIMRRKSPQEASVADGRLRRAHRGIG